ncbi:MAG: DUF3084 domain-containing protein [Chthonomonadales bacterium]|nr:DUF3084 domain-containing protein [Chthonomonadales bacterium]
MWTATALVLTVLVGGVIAYTGDLIGRRFGKRRASIFGLRPKHTAILITTVTGVLISGLTTGALFLAVPPVRNVMLRGEQAIRLNRGLSRSNRALHAQNARERQAAEAARAARQQAVLELRRSVADQKEAARRLASTRTQLRDLTDQLGVVTRRLQVAAAQRARARRDAADARREVRMEKAVAQTLAQRNEQLRRQAVGLLARSADLARRNADLARTGDELRRDVEAQRQANVQYVQVNADISRQNEALTRTNDELTDFGKKLLDRKLELSNQVEELEARNELLAKGWVDAFGKNRNLWEMFGAMRTRRVAVRGGEDLARTVIAPNTPPSEVRSAIESLLHEAHLAALAKGAGVGDGARAVQVVDKQFLTRTASGEDVTVRVTEDERVQAVTNRLAWSPEPVCVLALAVANSVEREPAAIDLQPFPNRLVYRKGQTVAERRVDATRPADQVFSELVTLLKGLGQSALTRGMIPSIDPDTLEPQVGSLSAAALVRLTDRVKAAGRRIRVYAVAASDTSAADPLRLDFRVEPSG